MNDYDKKLLYITIPVFILLTGLIIALSLLYVKVYDDEKHTDKTDQNEMILLSLKDISFSSYLQRTTTYQDLIKFHEQVNDQPYIDIYFSYTTIPDGLNFRVIDRDSNIVSESRSYASEKMGHSQWRYPFKNNGSSFYTLQYILSNATSNINNISINRVEVLS